MPKTIDVPSELRPFNYIFERFQYKFDDSQAFNDFLDLIILKFCPDRKLASEIKTRYGIEMKTMNELVECFFVTQQKQLEGRKWYDLLGNFYETLASRSKKSSFGQFFTPENIVDMMTMINGGAENKTGKGLKINDPACGSGRFLLSFHAHHLGNYMFGEDLDATCCKMAIINLCIHGAVGEIIHHDSLMPDSFYNGWWVNESLNKTGIPTIRKIKKEQSYILKMWENQKKEAA